MRKLFVVPLLGKKIGTVVSCSCAPFIVVFCLHCNIFLRFKPYGFSQLSQHRSSPASSLPISLFIVCRDVSASVCVCVWLLTKPINKHVQPVKSDTILFTVYAGCTTIRM